MLEPFVINALIGGIGVALVAGPLGCFVVWKRMAYFGDSLAHSSLLGIALGVLLGVGVNSGIILACVLFAAMILYLDRSRTLAMDTVLGIMAHAALAVGMVVLSLMRNTRIDLFGFLFGDILAIDNQALLWIYLGGAVILLLLILLWRGLILTTINEDLAKAEGISTLLMQVGFMLLMTLVIAISIRMVGVLLITSLLIIPAATARHIARTPEQMAILAALFGVVAVITGIMGSLTWDVPTGPAIVVGAVAIFTLLLLSESLWKGIKRVR